jgi:hypothetical protein
LRDAALVHGGENVNPIHGTIGNEDMLVGGVVGDMAMMRLAKGIVGG